MGQSLIRGALIITVASLISKMLGSVFRIPLQNIAGDDVFGIFSIVYPVYMSVLILSVAGIPLAVSKLVSEAEVKGDKPLVRDLFVTSGILGLIFGVTGFLLIWSFSGMLGELLGGRVMEPALLAVSLSLLVAPYMAVYRGMFQGFGTMTPTAVSQVIEQLIRVAVILVAAMLLVAAGQPPATVAAGVMTGSVVGALGSLVYLRIMWVRSAMRPKKVAEPYTYGRFNAVGKTILKLSLPICFGALAVSFLALIDSLTVPYLLRAEGNSELETAVLFGHYSRGIALVQIVIVVAQALILPVVPRIAAALEKQEEGEAAGITAQALTLTHFLIWPATVGLFVLTVPVNVALFGDAVASDVMAVVHLSAGFMAFSILTTGIIQGIGRAVTGAWIVAGVSVLKLVLNVVLVSQIGLMGVAWSTLVAYLALLGGNVWLIRRVMRVRLPAKKIAGFALSSLLMGAMLFAAMHVLGSGDWDRQTSAWFVTGAILAGATLYAAGLFGSRTFTKDDVRAVVRIARGR